MLLFWEPAPSRSISACIWSENQLLQDQSAHAFDLRISSFKINQRMHLIWESAPSNSKLSGDHSTRPLHLFMAHSGAIDVSFVNIYIHFALPFSRHFLCAPAHRCHLASWAKARQLWKCVASFLFPSLSEPNAVKMAADLMPVNKTTLNKTRVPPTDNVMH